MKQTEAIESLKELMATYLPGKEFWDKCLKVGKNSIEGETEDRCNFRIVLLQSEEELALVKDHRNIIVKYAADFADPIAPEEEMTCSLYELCWRLYSGLW